MKYKKFSPSGAVLKWIAIIAMFLDHVGVCILKNNHLIKLADAVLGGNSYDYMVSDYFTWTGVYIFCRFIGRLAFPLFCFLLVEGFLHTKNVKKYAFRLLLFSIISEIPFNLAVFDTIFHPNAQNVFFTLFIGLCVLYSLDRMTEKLPANLLPLRYLAVFAGMCTAILLKTDYDAYGILLIALLYELRNNRKRQCIFGAFLTLFNSYTAFLSFLFILAYNGKRARQLSKYFFYAFYPVHLLLLYGIRVLFLS